MQINCRNFKMSNTLIIFNVHSISEQAYIHIEGIGTMS